MQLKACQTQKLHKGLQCPSGILQLKHKVTTTATTVCYLLW